MPADQSAASSSQEASTAGLPKQPWYRNPWIWGAIAGLIFVPAIRPFTRHIPDAPPVLTTVPQFDLVTESGEPFSSERLATKVYVMGFYGDLCEPGCAGMLSALQQLSARFVRFERGITVLAVELPGAVQGEPSKGPGLSPSTAVLTLDSGGSWFQLTGSKAGLDALVGRALAPQFSAQEAFGLAEVAGQGRSFLVDAFGKLRGHYAIDESGLDEVYHRAQHVLRDHRINNEL
ncbi:MAG: hypothetical protein CMP23_16565 [Rickettsiales bacterium]|nr:hypothetical protein [Rickettsiales bacterium]|tara:strand:- start:2580 stop:3278 length:699 start_codon:yes stop_codon:yes gene_type:complete